MRNSNPRGAKQRRQLTQRKIEKRKKIITDAWGDEHNPLILQPHRLAKNNLSCGCGICKPHKHVGNNTIGSFKRPVVSSREAVIENIDTDRVYEAPKYDIEDVL